MNRTLLHLLHFNISLQSESASSILLNNSRLASTFVLCKFTVTRIIIPHAIEVFEPLNKELGGFPSPMQIPAQNQAWSVQLEAFFCIELLKTDRYFCKYNLSCLVCAKCKKY